LELFLISISKNKQKKQAYHDTPVFFTLLLSALFMLDGGPKRALLSYTHLCMEASLLRILPLTQAADKK
jgi:hypothetical protein